MRAGIDAAPLRRSKDEDVSDQRKTDAPRFDDAGIRGGVGGLLRSAAATVAAALRRQARLFGAILLATMLVASAVTALQVPRYVAVAEVLLQTRGGAAVMADAERSDASELRAIGSTDMARAVARSLALDRDPAFLEAEQANPVSRLSSVFGARRQPTAVPAADLTRQVIDRLQTNLHVAPVSGTYALAIRFTSVDPQRAADVANAYARVYTAAVPTGTREPTGTVRPAARLISEAEPPLTPASPRWLANVAIAALAGALLGLGAAVFAERRYDVLSSSIDVQAKLGLLHLGSVPTLASVLPDARSPLQAVTEAPLSAFAEAFRSLFLTIRQVGGRNTQVIAITSSLPNEGKTTIAACLARSIALANEPVVLIDCDARRRDVSTLYGADATRPGLAQVLRCEATLDEALMRDPSSSAWILPLTGPPADLSDLLGGAAMGTLLEDLRRRFKRIVIDSAPVLPISASRALVTHADLVVMVVRWRVTSRRAVLAALRLLPDNLVTIGGVVLSQTDMRKARKYSEDDPAFYYKQYEKYYT